MPYLCVGFSSFSVVSNECVLAALCRRNKGVDSKASEEARRRLLDEKRSFLSRWIIEKENRLKTKREFLEHQGTKAMSYFSDCRRTFFT